MNVDPERAIAAMRARRDALTNPRHVALVDIWIEHLESERAGDVERILDHLADDVRYRRWGHDREEFGSKDVMRRRFERVREGGGGVWPAYEFEIDRLLVDDEHIVMDGMFRSQIRGAQLRAQNAPLPEDAKDEDEFVIERRYCMFVTFRGSEVVGEDAYRDRASIVKLPAPG
jgi:hypothetical protein